MITNPPRPISESYWVIPGRFLAGQYPGSLHGDEAFTRQRLTAFFNAGFDTFFDLTRIYELSPYVSLLNEVAKFFQHEIHYRRFSIGDRGLPTLEQMTDILNALDGGLSVGRKIYLHCQGGIGRTGTTVGCFLVRHGLAGEEALHRLNELYCTATQSSIFPSSPETEEQIKFILNWTEDGD